MAYYHNDSEETRRNSLVPPEQGYEQEYQPDYPQEYYPADDQPYGTPYESDSEYPEDEYIDDYDDGFDETDDGDYPEDELTEEEKQEIKKDRIQLLFGAGDLTGIIIGTVVILLLLAFLFQMINFVRDDIHEFFDTIGRFFK